MNKSQNTKKDLCITSEQLTKQLATESLPEYTEFYVRKKDGSTDTQTWLNRRHSSAVEWWNTFEIVKVLAPVPSYEKWKAKLEENAQLKERVSKLEKMQYSYTPEEWNTMLRTVNRTKEMLKECVELMDNTNVMNINIDVYMQRKKDVLNAISQALGEDK